VETRIELLAAPAENKMRLEDFLCDRFRGLSKMYLREVVKGEQCEVNGRSENVGYRLRSNDFIEIELDLSREHSMLPQEIPLDILFEDNDLIVANKPTGMLVHPSHREKTGTLLNALMFHLNRRSEPSALAGGPANVDGSAFIRPGLIHRLDKDTSGLIVVAKNPRAHRILSAHFQRKLVEKRYIALVDGIVKDDAGTITGDIGRHDERKHWGLKEGGKPSETRFVVRERYANRTLLDLEPVTGRTNQLRIHCASIGHPIVGDIVRGGREFTRLCLHAYKIAFKHPSGGERIECEVLVEFEKMN
jgi:23S rRNA pseudouridine1911/1915/1917 synthase